VDDPTSELLALDPEEFTAARDALAKRLHAGGDREAAAAVRSLRRPTVPVWLLNRVARESPDVVAAAVDVGVDLRVAQEAALRERDGTALRGLAARRRKVVEDVVTAVVLAAQSHGRAVSAAHRDVVTATVEVALADAALAAEWASARLTETRAVSGFGLVTGDVEKAPARETPGVAKPSPESTGPAESFDERLAAAGEKAARLRAEADAARAEVEHRLAEWTGAERAAKQARQALREAERAASRADLLAATAEQAAWEVGERARR